MGQSEAEIKKSGPIRIGKIDCRGCTEDSNLNNPECRKCVFENLGKEKNAEWIILERSLKRVYHDPRVSEIAASLSSLETMIHDENHYTPRHIPNSSKKCQDCVERRKEKIIKAWEKIKKNPHDLGIIKDIVDEERKIADGEKCQKCTSNTLSTLYKKIKKIFSEIESWKELDPDNYNEILDSSKVPFFIEGVWKNIDGKAELIDKYSLENDRGQARIYRQENRPVPYYDLDFPEKKITSEKLSLLDKAYNEKIKSSPGHASFAESESVPRFTKEWYELLLHKIRDEENTNIPAGELRKLAEYMTNWLRYSVLEPLSHDEHITDIYFTAPPEKNPMTVVHDKWGKCETGFYLTTRSLISLGELLAARLDTNFDKVNPRLDAEIPELGMRLFMTRPPAIWTDSIAAMVRRRRSKPWTQPLFLQKQTLTPLASSLLSHYLRYGASGFVTGDIGTAKTSTIETFIPEIGPKERIVCYQDTEEINIENFQKEGYEVENVRVRSSEDLQKQINAFLRGGAAYWLITEVRSTEAVKSALGAAARRGSQPVVSSFHVRTKRQMFDLVCNIMGLHKSAYKYMDLFISTAKFDSSHGAVRRVTEISEVLKDWDEKPEYTTLMEDDRENDIIKPVNLFSGDSSKIAKISRHDISEIDVMDLAQNIRFTPPEEDGSRFIEKISDRLSIEKEELMKSILAEVRIKSDILKIYQNTGQKKYLELPFVSKAYDFYSASLDKNSRNYRKTISGFENWLSNQ